MLKTTLRKTLGRTVSKEFKKFMSTFNVGYIAPSQHAALKTIPQSLTVNQREVRFSRVHPGNGLTNFDCLLIIPGVKLEELSNIWKSNKAPWMHCFFAGIDGLVPFFKLENLQNREDFLVSNGRSAFSESLAEYCLAAMLYFNKQIPRLEHNRKNKIWDPFIMNTVTGSKVTFVGFGHIGQTTARLLQKTLNVSIDVIKRSKVSPDDFNGLKIDSVYSFEDEDRFKALRDADYVISSLPGTPESYKFIGVKEFAAMKESSVFISIGRGVTIDEEALENALRGSSIAGAALDVFHIEPLPSTSTLWNAPNLLISPHNADNTVDYNELGFSVFVENLKSYLTSGNLVTKADKTLGY